MHCNQLCLLYTGPITGTSFLSSICRCTQLVRKLPLTEKDEWVRQIEHKQVSEDVKGLAEWAQVLAKTLRKCERNNEQSTISTKNRFSGGSTQPSSLLIECKQLPQVVFNSAAKHEGMWGHFVMLIEICVHLIRVKPGHISYLWRDMETHRPPDIYTYDQR